MIGHLNADTLGSYLLDWGERMAFDEAKKAVVTAIETRLNNQIIGSFSISRCLFNWKAIATIAFPSSVSLAARFTELEAQGYVGLKPYGHMLVYPTLSTLFILFVIPPASLLPELWENFIQNIRNLIKSQFSHNRMMHRSEHEAETEELRNQISKLQQEAHNNEQAFENRGRQVKEREAEVAGLKKSIVDIEALQNGLQAKIAEQEQIIKTLATEKEVSEKDRAMLQNEIDSQKIVIADTAQELIKAHEMADKLMPELDKMRRTYNETITDRDKMIETLHKDLSSFRSKIDQQASELEQLKKKSKPLPIIEQLAELFKPAAKSGREEFNRKIPASLTNGLTDGLDTVSIDIDILIDKLRAGNISKEELFDLRNKLIAGQKDNLKATMIIKNLSDAQKLLFPNKNK